MEEVRELIEWESFSSQIHQSYETEFSALLSHPSILEAASLWRLRSTHVGEKEEKEENEENEGEELVTQPCGGGECPLPATSLTSDPTAMRRLCHILSSPPPSLPSLSHSHSIFPRSYETSLPKGNGLEGEWINCDIRTFDMTTLGKFSAIYLDPPWDIRMDLPYGTLTDKELLYLDLAPLCDDGLIFMWVTGRTMELGRELMTKWGYDMIDSLVWIKVTPQHRLLRQRKTGYYLNHTKEHCLIGKKGNPIINRHMYCDVLVSELRKTSQKPDEMYSMIENICGEGRKLEIFGRVNNIQKGWITLGNQLPGIQIFDSLLRLKKS